MGWWNKSKTKEKERQVISEKTIYKLFLVWDDDNAEYFYTLRKATQATCDNGDVYNYSNMYASTYLGRRGWYYVSSGNLGWARKQSKHYNIDIPTKEDPHENDSDF